jgi:hypothetical protein
MSRYLPSCALAAAVLLGSSIPALAEGRFGPVHVAANRSEYVGKRCPVSIVYSATIRFEPHRRGFVFHYYWERSDGSKGPVHRVRVSPGERSMLVRENWRFGRRGEERDATATIYLDSGDIHERHVSPTVHVACR